MKIYLLKATSQIGQKKIFMIKKVKNTVLWICYNVISDLNGEKLIK